MNSKGQGWILEHITAITAITAIRMRVNATSGSSLGLSLY